MRSFGMGRLALLLALIWTTAAQPGAWPRSVGETFVSAKGSVPAGGDADEAIYTLYGERGATERLTLGGKYDRLTPTLSVTESFARWHVSAPDATWQIAVEGGLAVTIDLEPETWPTWRDRIAILAAGHLGRGFPTPFGDGWVDIRLGGLWPMNEDARTLKLDATTGVALASGHLVMLDLRHEQSADAALTLVGPSGALKLGERLTLTAGVLLDVSGDLPEKIELGAWLTF